ncbi:MAG: ABC transporter ATP-binding protein [Planctomycetota bacterium]|jgi:ABC-2 type transport system ATP-binding protein
MPPSVVVSGLSKTFRVRRRAKGLSGSVRQLFKPESDEVVALDGLSFEIEEGERVAFVGPNGAGKSTTIKILTGILHPTGGDAHVLGEVPWRSREKLAYRLGTVFGQRTQLWYHLPAADTFDLLARIYELDDAVYAKRRGELVEAFALQPLLDKPVRQLSLGERMRCEIVASLLHAPQVLFLDEPTIGLDVTAKATIRDLVHDMSVRDKSTVLLTSHDTGDMERVCDRVIVINHGKLLLDEPVSSLRQNYIRRKRVTLLTAESDVAIEMDGVERVEHAPHRTVFEVDTTKTPVEAVVAAALEASRLRDLTVEDPPMEEIVKAIYAAS